MLFNTDQSVDTADRLHWKSRHHSAQAGWHIAREEVLELKLKAVVWSQQRPQFESTYFTEAPNP